ncbi:SUMF1/EgtB/PvdO family nonheme iron enzyme [bacterium]|nr:SUMF1/EgtB/PvdO family nonheme iron enzyme [bacterium]
MWLKVMVALFVVPICSTSMLDAAMFLEINPGGVGHEADVELVWSPSDPQDVMFHSIGHPFNVLLNTVLPNQYHLGVMADGVNYAYKVVEPDSVLLPGDLFATDTIVGDMRYVPAPTPWGFFQGSPVDEPCREDDETQFKHVLTRDFAVMETEVTRQMWADLLAGQSTLPNDPTHTSYGSGLTNPVQNLTWFEAVLFANLLSLQNGLDQCYYADANFTVPLDATNYMTGPYFCDFEALGYRLMSEGEWEYAARAETTTPFSVNETNYTSSTCGEPLCVTGEFPTLEQYAVYCANDNGTSEPVGSRIANPWNLHDMTGNVWEFCWDCYAAVYPADTTDYAGPTSGSYRVVRGGAWNDYALNCRSANRDAVMPDSPSFDIGFRLARTVTLAPVIQSIIDTDVCVQNGIQIEFNFSVDADRYDLWVDGLERATNISSPCFYNPGDSLGHDYVIRAVYGTTHYDSAIVTFTDVNNTPVPIITGLDENICPSESVSLSTETGMTDYQWYLEASPLAGETTETLITSVSGQYTVSYMNSQGCHGLSEALTVSITPCSGCPSGGLYALDAIVGKIRCVCPGSFTQGSPTDEPCRISSERQFSHTLTRTVAVMATEVTRQMWADLLAVQPTLPIDPSDLNISPTMSHPLNRPLWFEAVLFANLLSVQNGLTRCYYSDAGFTTPIDATNYMTGPFYCNFDASGYRLLSEGEWEYAARAGTTTPYGCAETNLTADNCYSGTPGELPVLEQYAVFVANSSGTSEPVGSKLANAWKLKDMHGNVYEWCWDWYGAYPIPPTNDYTGPASGTNRMARGGHNGCYPAELRSAYRFASSLGIRYNGFGFRLVRTVTLP